MFLIVGALGTFTGGPQIVGAYIGKVLFAAMAQAVAAILGKNTEQQVVPYSFTLERIEITCIVNKRSGENLNYCFLTPVFDTMYTVGLEREGKS